MAPKKAAGSKKKEAPLSSSPEDLAPFGLKVNDIINTPLALTATVIGVRSAGSKDNARVWVKYENGHEGPLEPQLLGNRQAGMLEAPGGQPGLVDLGYLRCSEALHIKRDHSSYLAEQVALEKKKKVVAEVTRLQQLGLPMPEALLPKSMKEPKEDKKGKDGKDGKGKDGKDAKKGKK